MEKNISIDSILKNELKNLDFKQGFEAESEKLESAYAIYKARYELTDTGDYSKDNYLRNH